MKKLTTVIILSTLYAMLLCTAASAQPAQSRVQSARNGATGIGAQKNSQNNSAKKGALSVRAQISYPVAQQMREDVVWRRDIYREIDLMQGDNSGLYYPVEAVGAQMNLFTYLFKLVLSGQIKAYEYRLDGNESFEPSALIKPLALLDNYHIYYEKKDGRLHLDNSDIPSREVKSYYIKESSYFDQVSATFHTKVIALCPIMTREDDFGDGSSKYPLFWVKYDDCAPFLSKQTIMTSDINNAATMSIDDYFLKHRYQGKIYKTNNMLGQTLAQYCPTDSAMIQEQKRIERELKDFEENIWGDKARRDSLDSIAKIDKKAVKEKKPRTSRRTDSTEQKQEAAVSKKRSANRSSSSAASAGTGRVSVRRQRH